MQKHTKLAIIGGTGKAGKYLVSQLLAKGFNLKLLLRDPHKLAMDSPFIEIITGDARNYNSVLAVIEGCQAVISTLGQPRAEPTIFSQATTNILRAMTQHQVTRYILLTGLTVDAPGDRKGAWSQMATDWMYANYPETTRDKQIEYNLLSESKIDWTIVRVPLIEQTDEDTDVAISLEDCPGENISSTALAGFLIEQLTDNTWVRKAPFVANRQ